MENENALKHKFGKDLLQRIAHALHAVYPKFDHKYFNGLERRLQPLEMKARVRLLRDELHGLLPADYLEALAVIMRSVPGGKLRDFDFWIYTEFIQTYGLGHESASLNALKILTTHFTSEWAVRPFLRQSPETALAFLLACAGDEDEKVRRWASEGSRPRLPWGERLHHFIANPRLTLPILEVLKFDPEIFVRTSVANHLNDLAKDHPDYVIEVLKRWQSEAGHAHLSPVNWIAKRALRTLIKAGNLGALELIGVRPARKIELKHFVVSPKTIVLGEILNIAFEIVSQAETDQKLVVDYVVHLVRARKRRSPKVFKFKTVQLRRGETVKLQKSHPIKSITTRSYYPGRHALEIQINGRSFGKRDWFLEIDP
jgi:3-methyladenine DNA glycosylase AlkC